MEKPHTYHEIFPSKLLIKDGLAFRLKQTLDEGDRVLTLSEEYEDIGPLETVTIHFLSREKPTASLKPAPESVTVIPVTLTQLSLQLFRDLYEAVSVSGGWWPLDDPHWPWENFFALQELYILCASGNPVGLGCIDRNIGEADTAKINYVGLIPSAQGKGYGSYFFDYLCNACTTGGTQRIILDTVPFYDRSPNGISAMEIYLRKGFNEYRNPETVSPAAVLSTPDGKLGLNQFNLPSYYKDNPLFEESYLERKLLKTWHEKFSPSS